jgi:tricorn protease-like protein
MIANKAKYLILLLLSMLIVSCSEDATQEEPINEADLSDAYEVRRLTYDGSQKSGLCFSPDGTKILFRKNEQNIIINDSYMMNLNGSNKRFVPLDEWIDNYYCMWSSDWTRDGKVEVSNDNEKVCFEYIDERKNGLYHVSSESATDYGLSGKKTQAAISPNGDKVAFVLKNENATDQSDGSEENPYYDLCVVENGKLLRFRSDEKAKEGIFLGTNLEHIGGPCFSSDSKQVVFSGKQEIDNDLFILALDDLQLTRITFNGANDYYPVISPDNQKIIFCSNRSGHDDIYIMDLTKPTGK